MSDFFATVLMILPTHSSLLLLFLHLSSFCCKLLYKAVSKLISNLPIVRVGLFFEVKQRIFVIRVCVSEALVKVKNIYIREISLWKN